MDYGDVTVFPLIFMDDASHPASLACNLHSAGGGWGGDGTLCCVCMRFCLVRLWSAESEGQASVVERCLLILFLLREGLLLSQVEKCEYTSQEQLWC